MNATFFLIENNQIEVVPAIDAVFHVFRVFRDQEHESTEDTERIKASDRHLGLLGLGTRDF